jgi:hypothetical protein
MRLLWLFGSISAGATLAAIGCGGSAACDASGGGTACGGGGAGGGGGAAIPCAARFVGNYDDLQDYHAQCASLVHGGKSWTLDVDVDSPKLGGQTQIRIDLGASPTAGSFSSETLASWSAVAAESNSCAFEAGSQVVPTGSFSLTLTKIDTAAGVVHGTLEILQTVHAPPMTDCGKDDHEQIDVQF